MNITTTYDEAMVKAMIAEAVAKEREECAKVCDVTVPGDEYLTAAINAYADAIRAKETKND